LEVAPKQRSNRLGNNHCPGDSQQWEVQPVARASFFVVFLEDPQDPTLEAILLAPDSTDDANNTDTPPSSKNGVDLATSPKARGPFPRME
jgi:hypothetical protein